MARFIPTRPGRIALGVVVVLASAGTASGQPPEADPVRTATLLRPQPLEGGVVEAPILPPPAVAPAPVIGFPPLPPPQPGPPPGCAIPAPQCDPLKKFEYCFASGGRATLFPGSLLWEPPLAQKGEPRLELLPNTLNSPTSQRTLDTYIGATAGLLRYTAPCGLAVQLDAFAVVGSRVSQYDFLIASDYRAGLPITFGWGPWHGKIGYEHTSTHLGDDLITMTGQQPIPSVKDEIVMGLGRWFFDQLRVYGELGYALSQNLSVDADPIRFNFGLEWRTRQPTGWWGRPFGATNIEFRGDQNYDPNFTLQIGWMWRNPNQRLACFRVFGEFFTGHAPYGQLFQERNQFFGLGVAIDY